MNDFESILNRMKAQLKGNVSTIEGTFAGDLLQAVATELARICSQEIDTVTQRGFVATANGSWLDAACADYGVTRKNGESDDALRERTLSRIRRQAGSGNAANYAAWALSLDGVAAASAVPLARGTGTVDVWIIPEADAPESLIDGVRAFIGEKRPVGADVAVTQATPIPLTVSATVLLEPGTSTEAVQSAFSAALTQWLERVRLTEAGTTVSLSRIISLLMDCDGVQDVSGVLLAGESVNAVIPTGSYAACGAVTLTEASHV